MKAFQALFVLTGIFLIAGIWVLYPISPVTESYTEDVGVGAENYTYVPFTIYTAGRISGTFSEAAGRTLTFYVFDRNDFNTFFNTTTTPQGMYQTTASSGAFSVSVQAPGTYYIVVGHGPGNEQTIQPFTLSVLLDGINSLFLGLGVGLVATAIALGAAGYIQKRKVERETQVPKPSDVVLFDKPSAPPPPE